MRGHIRRRSVHSAAAGAPHGAVLQPLPPILERGHSGLNCGRALLQTGDLLRRHGVLLGRLRVASGPHGHFLRYVPARTNWHGDRPWSSDLRASYDLSVVFLLGKRSYRIIIPEKNPFRGFFKCIWVDVVVTDSYESDLIGHDLGRHRMRSPIDGEPSRSCHTGSIMPRTSSARTSCPTSRGS